MLDEGKKVRVLVVDDSAVMRKLIPGLLSRDDGIEVVATAIDGDFALSKIDQFKPDVVTLDIDMPRMDGLTALRHIVAVHSVPVVMLSSLTTRGAALTMKALEIGAVDFVCKPKDPAHVGEMSAELASKIKSAARTRLIPISPEIPARRAPRRKQPGGDRVREAAKVIAIGASSGGPHALRYLLPRIPPDVAAGIVVVQHMPESFTAMLAKWLDEICEISVSEAREGDLVTPGRALIAPGNCHLKVVRKALGAEVVLERGQPVNGHRPSVDVLFRSVADEYGLDATAVIMTGMGSDGAEGIGQIRKAGGHTLAQDKESCAIFGMPRVAIDKGYIDQVVPLSEMSSYLVSRVGLTRLEVNNHAERW